MTDTTAEQRGWGPGWPSCAADKQVTIHPVGRALTVRKELAVVFDYYTRRYDAEVEDINAVPDDGAFACRPIRGSSPPVASNHSWGLALDLNWDKHPLGATGTYTNTQLLALHTMLSEIGFMRCGVDYTGRHDPMHHEWMGTPADAAHVTARIHALQPWPVFDGILLKQGMGNSRTRLVNSRLGFGTTSTTYTANTAARVRAFQSSRHLPVTGIVDAATWKRLEWRLP